MTQLVPQEVSGRVAHRRRRMWVGTGVAVVLFAAAAAIGFTRDSKPAPPPASFGTQLDRPIPAQIADLPLTDEYGKTTTLASLHGKTVVLTDFLTLCQEVCPITMSQLNRVAESVHREGGTNVQFVGITVDPERDTPQRLHAYRTFAGLAPNWTLLTGSASDIATIWKFFGAYYARAPEEEPPGIDWLTGKPLTYDVIHQDVLVFLDAAGRERFVVQGPPVGRDAPLTEGERNFLNDEGRANLAGDAEATWTPNQALGVVSWLTGRKFNLR
ncbi:MAG: SCO family protein [Acidothermus sp.]|nr:SCO family protein [Acidothermus sp.]MCL6537508.1 SCO family protein [Acidothermus sp.]